MLRLRLLSSYEKDCPSRYRKIAAGMIILMLLAVAGVRALPMNSFVYPVVHPKLTSSFGSRVHPIKRVRRNHSGVDLAAPIGAPVRAISAGVIIFADPWGGYGNFIVIKHQSEITSHYGHLDLMRVQPGEKVAAGQIIGTVGSTGESTGPHLHLELRQSGQPLDPLRYIPGLTTEAEG